MNLLSRNPVKLFQVCNIQSVSFFHNNNNIALKKATSEYSERVKISVTTDNVLYNLGWSVDELSRLNQQSGLSWWK